jgi:hypothetical protein
VTSWLDDKRRDGWSAPPIERLYVGRSKNAEAPLPAPGLQVFRAAIDHLEGARVGLPGTMLPRMGRTPIDGCQILPILSVEKH